MKPRRFPYGYMMIGGKIVISEDEAEVILRIFQMRLDGKSCYMIAKALHDSGIEYFSDSIKKADCNMQPMSSFDELIVRRLVEEIIVLSKTKNKVVFHGGLEYESEVENRRRKE